MPPIIRLKSRLREKTRGWNRLPQEIRHRIVQFLIQDGSSLASLAAVSLAWQVEVERHNFARIRLTPSRLADFHSMIYRNRPLVDYIWFCLELDDYDCALCAPKNDASVSTEDLIASVTVTDTDKCPITASFKKLFSVLSTWDPVRDLVLDISIYSPSDAEHWFKYLTFLPDYHRQPIPDKGSHDPQHGWIAGYQVTPPPRMAFLKVFHDVMGEGPFDHSGVECDWWDELPSVPAVTCLLLRQQNRRRWKPQVLPHLFARFPRLEEVHYEPWREWTLMQKFTDRVFVQFFKSVRRLDTPLKKLVIFENFNEQYPPCIRDRPGCDQFRRPNRAVSQKATLASFQLEHLAASFIVDAKIIFTTAQTREWPNLSSLVLTSTLLRPDENPFRIRDMLLAAATAALRMPRLETMEIWNGRQGVAAVFRYQVVRNARQATITWRATWEFGFHFDLIRAWRAVIRRRFDDTWDIRVVYEWLDAEVIRSHGDAIVRLKFCGQIIRPVSLQQIRAEQRALNGVKTV